MAPECGCGTQFIFIDIDNGRGAEGGRGLPKLPIKCSILGFTMFLESVRVLGSVVYSDCFLWYTDSLSLPHVLRSLEAYGHTKADFYVIHGKLCC